MKYKLTEQTKEVFGITLYRIQALKDFSNVKAGDLGGWIESERNLSQNCDAWVSNNAWVFGNARVSGNARVEYSFNYLLIGPIGSRAAFTTFYRTEIGICVSCGCFNGTLDEFSAKVEKTHGNNQHGKTYKAAINMAIECLKGE